MEGGLVMGTSSQHSITIRHTDAATARTEYITGHKVLPGPGQQPGVPNWPGAAPPTGFR